ncbi:hypothetical protein PHYBOEH_008720 [Phytophthora boehmeriae]|uniref:Dynein regulatory complex protein 10 n=1 Tax=Phytophthora boehmeriae TaxID=109152 RepID=A0A8T1X0V7_9STRA|nr:hypothetical protein PHYBOEH_008720 [Phytophthora boehmeriae]
MTSLSVRFEGEVWLLQEPKSAFYAPRYCQERLLVRGRVFPFWKQPQSVVELGQAGQFLVLTAVSGDASKLSGDPKETKKLLTVTVRPLEDVRRAQLYQTAVRTQTLELFVDAEDTRERLLKSLQLIPDASGEESSQKEEAADTGKRTLDDAFAALERAQQSRDKGAALRLYRAAETGFYKAEGLVTDERSKQFLSDRRRDLQRTIRGLEDQINARLEVAAASAAVGSSEVTTPPTCDISARLDELRRFAAQQDNKRGQQNGTDLVSRLAALKYEKAGPAPPMDDLAERLRRLRGDSEQPSVPTARGVNLEKKNAVDQIIEQVADEIALGIDDEISSFDQDERLELSHRDSLMRLREIEDDRDQVAFELKQACDARAAMTRKFTEQRTRLEVQLRDTKSAADDILIPLARDREENLQALLSTFETQNSSAKEQLEAIDRTMTRVTQASQQVEIDERKHTQHCTTELRELLERYDTDMERLDSEIEEERAELSRLDAANGKFEMYFARIDNDRRNQLEEQRVFDLSERMRRNREASMFYFTIRIQAVVRGFLARRKSRLEAERKKSVPRKKEKKSKKSTSKSKSPKRKKPIKKKPTAKVRIKKP